MNMIAIVSIGMPLRLIANINDIAHCEVRRFIVFFSYALSRVGGAFISRFKEMPYNKYMEVFTI